MATTDDDDYRNLWTQASKYLEPSQSVERIDAYAKFNLGFVAFVSALISGFGLVGANSIKSGGPTSYLASLTLVLALIAVLLALFSIIIRSQAVRLQNLAEIEEWFAREIKKARYVRLSALFLMLSVLSAGATATVALNTDSSVSRVSIATRAIEDGNSEVTIRFEPATNRENDGILVYQFSDGTQPELIGQLTLPDNPDLATTYEAEFSIPEGACVRVDSSVDNKELAVYCRGG